MAEGAAQATKPVPGVAARAPAACQAEAARQVVSEPGAAAERSAGACSPRAAIPGAGRVPVITVQRYVAHPIPAGARAAPRASSLVREVLAASGSDLDKPVQALMEDRFGHDFGAVRIHTGAWRTS